MIVFDHIAIAATDLAAGTTYVADVLGVPLQNGGRHDRYGTYNTLLGLGDIYLEVIALDPQATRTRPTWFGLDQFSGTARPANWICAMPDIADAPAFCGSVQSLERGDLRWQITVPDDGSLPYGGAYPTLIQWAADTVHPATRLSDSGCRLTKWQVSHPDADALRDMAAINDDRVEFNTGPLGFRAMFDTPGGSRVLA